VKSVLWSRTNIEIVLIGFWNLGEIPMAAWTRHSFGMCTRAQDHKTSRTK